MTTKAERENRFEADRRAWKREADEMLRELDARHRRRLDEMDIAAALRDYLREEFNCGAMGCRKDYADPLIRRALREIRALRSKAPASQ